MRRSSLYGHAAELFELISTTRQPADTIVDRFTRSRRYLGAKDRRFITALLYDLLRHHARLAAYVRAALAAAAPAGTSPARITGAALCAARAIRDEGLTPEALLSDLGGLWRTTTTDIDPLRFFAALAAAELPELQSPSATERLAMEHSLPARVVDALITRWGADAAAEECAALNREAPVVIRVNTLKGAPDECRRELEARGFDARPAPLSPEGLILSRRVNFGGLDLFKDGWLEPQDEGSQLLSRVLNPAPGERIVDACAGGGGKTLHCAALMQNTGKLLALDVDASRLERLTERVRRGGISIVEVLTARPHDPSPPEWSGLADGVLVDAPCSGMGRYRRDPAAKLRFGEIDLPSLVRLQGSILSRAAEFVRPGGRLIYATCSLLLEENEEVVRRFLASHKGFQLSDAVQILREQGSDVGGSGPILHLTPHRHGTDGFTAAAMMRASV